MLEFFPTPLRSKVFSEDDFRHHTRYVSTTDLTFAERVAAHYTALLESRTLKLSNTDRGYCFTMCVYDGLVALRVDPIRITFNRRARPERNDDIDIVVEPYIATRAKMCLYLKTSLRERWKQVDRDARIAKDVWGNSLKAICLTYAEKGAKGFRKDCTHLGRLEKKFTDMEEWANGVDAYASFAQIIKVNKLIAYLLEDGRTC